MKRGTVVALVAGGLMAATAVTMSRRRPDGPADIKCGPGRLMTVSARWSNGRLVIPDSVLALAARELSDCELDGQPVKVPRADGGTR